MAPLTIFPARSVRTVDPGLPTAEAVAVAEHHIVAVGSLADLRARGPHEIDDTFADSVLVPGFVEAHSHVFEGGMWAFEYVGAYDRLGPDGVVRPACTSVADLVDRLRALERTIDDPAETLIVWGFDPIHLDDEHLGARHLDAVSESRPIFVFHASGHLATVNTALMRAEGFADGIDMEGVPTDGDGRPTGELQEPAAMSLARTAFSTLLRRIGEPDAIERFGAIAARSGTTTLTDLGTVRLGDEEAVGSWLRVTSDPSFPARVSLFHNPGFAGPADPDEAVEFVQALAARSTHRLRFGHVKLVLDGSIQGFTARVGFPGYLGDRPNGLWLLAPEQFHAFFDAMHRAGILVHVHCNGDEATGLFIETLERILVDHPHPDHRHTVQHCQLTTPAQYRRLAVLGANVNLFTNHLWFWGDQHRDLTVGRDRASRMDACATAAREGIRFSIHSDASITPLGHLHTMWCAVNRVTPSGDVLGPDERVSAEQALRAATIDAAFQLRMDHEIGSIEAGKRADLTALSDDPCSVDPMAIRDLDVHGTVAGGTVHAVGRP